MTDERLLKAYRTAFSGESGKVVLDDLMDFCCMFQCTAGMDTELYEGRRTVFLYILQSMGLTNTYNIVTALLNVPPELAEKQEKADGAETGEEG